MRCLVTAGPTWEPLDKVRRLTNFSTGRLGGTLANHLAQAGHDVTLFLSETATWQAPLAAVRVAPFSTTATLATRLQHAATAEPVAIFHAAAVSDFTGGTAWERGEDGSLRPLSAGKLSTRSGPLLVELKPTPKILPQLRGWFPDGRIVGWKYEVDAGRDGAITAGLRQLAEAATDACVVNGPAYGNGFGWLQAGLHSRHIPDAAALFAQLTEFAAQP